MEQPIWVTNEYGDSAEIVKGWGLEILDHKQFGDYQGDDAYLLRSHDGEIGLFVLGYGSCHGCDHFMFLCESARDLGDWTDVVEYARTLLNSIHWEDSKEELMDWVNESAENGYNWWNYDTEAIEWLNSHGAKVEDPAY